MAKNSLHIGKGFDLPLDLVTSTQAILARKRSGKSYTASVQAEEMLAAGQQIGVIDPTGAWWGLRASADGTDIGFPIVVFGGDHEDAPLDSRAGKAMAAAFVEHGFSAIFDIGNFSTEEQLLFVSDFCAELLRINREALHLFMDEADTFAPQTPRSVAANKCLGTVSRLVKQGGIRGVGFTMITQRAASINWDILSQIDLLTILRMSAPHDVDPVVKWLQSETTKEFAAEVKAALPALTVGTAFFASAPLKIAQRVEVRTRKTFNSGATPKPGERRAEPKVLASVDIERLGAEIAASVKEAKENSVDALRARIAELEAQPKTDDTERVMELMEQMAAIQAEAAKVPELESAAQRLREREIALLGVLREVAERIDTALMDATCGESLTVYPASGERVPVTAVSLSERPSFMVTREESVEELRKQYPPAASAGGALPAGERKMLTALAQYPKGLKRPTLTVFTDFARSTRDVYLQRLSAKGFVEVNPNRAVITQEGLQALGSFTRLPVGAELRRYWINKLPKGESEILQHVCAHRAGISRDQLAEITGFARSTRDAYIQRLTAKLLVTSDGLVRPSNDLFSAIER